MLNRAYAVIMAGGKGERFWPLSSEARPKQLLALTSEKSMLNVTCERITGLIPPEQILIVAGENISGAILDSCPTIRPENMLAEPFGRNTCLAIGCAAVHLQKRDSDAIMVVLSADHLIEPASKMLEVVKVGTKVAAEGNQLITIGIVPSRAETGYGYIELSDSQWKVDGVTVCRVAAFKEKPRPMVAQQYYLDRQHLWNSGMFIWSANSVLEAIGRCRPTVRAALDEYAKALGTSGQADALDQLYRMGESVSVDVAVLETADNVVVIKGDLKWDDVGSWLAMQRIRKTHLNGNVEIGRVLCLDTVETTVVNDADGIVVCFGVADLVVVRTANIVMVAHKSQVPEIKKLLGHIEADEQLRQYL